MCMLICTQADPSQDRGLLIAGIMWLCPATHAHLGCNCRLPVWGRAGSVCDYSMWFPLVRLRFLQVDPASILFRGLCVRMGIATGVADGIKVSQAATPAIGRSTLSGTGSNLRSFGMHQYPCWLHMKLILCLTSELAPPVKCSTVQGVGASAAKPTTSKPRHSTGFVEDSLVRVISAACMT